MEFAIPRYKTVLKEVICLLEKILGPDIFY